MLWLSLLAAVLLAAMHLAAPAVGGGHGERSPWLSVFSGVSVAYVFVHLLPELEAQGVVLEEAAVGVLAYLEHHVYLLALAGLIAFYGLERLAQARGGGDEGGGVYLLHLGSFALYNGLIGFLLVHLEEPGAWPLALYTLAMGLHFVVNDAALERHHRAAYRRRGRWVLCAAILLGWGVGALTGPSPGAAALLLALLAGGVILNVLKEELPEARRSRFGRFTLGAVAYAALLLLL